LSRLALIDEDRRELVIRGDPEVFAHDATGALAPDTEPAVITVAQETGHPELALLNGAGAAEFSEVWLAARINGVPDQSPMLLLRHRNGRIFAPPDAFQQWRLNPPTTQAITFNGRTYVPLDGIDGLVYVVNDSTQEVVIQGGAHIFPATVIDPRSPSFAPPDRRTPGGFFNYDLQYLNQEDIRRVDGLFELGLFNRFGVGTSSFLGRELGEGSDVTSTPSR
jgi:hypothetical protein